MRIEILYFDGCPNHHLAENRVREVLAELQLRAKIIRVNVSDESIAAKVRFPGSPTVRIDGEDVVPGTDDGNFSLRCRVYATGSGLAGAPDTAAIRAAIRRRAT
jgi:hypothetical protein